MNELLGVVIGTDGLLVEFEDDVGALVVVVLEFAVADSKS